MQGHLDPDKVGGFRRDILTAYYVEDMPETAWKNLFCYNFEGKNQSLQHLVYFIGQFLRVNQSPPDLKPGLQSILEQQVTLFDKLLVHASLCKDSEVCGYPKCFDGKLLYRHFFFCKNKKRRCQTCNAIRRIIDFHARSCSESNCVVPRCRMDNVPASPFSIPFTPIVESINLKDSEIKKHKLRKQQRLTSIEERLQRLRLLEPQRAAAAAALQLSLEASVKDRNPNNIYCE